MGEDGPVDVALVERLAAPEGRSLLAALPPYAEAQVIGLVRRLRAQGHDPELVAAALTQSRLRSRAVSKLGQRAHAMLFTPDGLEQATRTQVSARHTARFTGAGVSRVLDLGCGIGADAGVLAQAGVEVTAVDADPVTAAVARANLAGHPAAQVRTARVEDVPLAGASRDGSGAWLDPARRTPGVGDPTGRARRVFRVDQLSPSWEVVQDVAAALGAVGAKLGPGFPRARIPPGVEAEWVSWGGAALECSLWWGDLRTSPGGRSVAVHDGSTWHTLTASPDGAGDIGEGDTGAGDIGSPGPVEAGCWVLDPDRALLAAGLLGELCRVVGGREIAPGSGYVVAPGAVSTPFARCRQVRQVLPLRPTALRAWARAHDIGPLTVKKRGALIDSDALRKQIRPRGTQEATVVVTRVGDQRESPVRVLWVGDPSPA